MLIVNTVFWDSICNFFFFNISVIILKRLCSSKEIYVKFLAPRCSEAVFLLKRLVLLILLVMSYAHVICLIILRFCKLDETNGKYLIPESCMPIKMKKKTSKILCCLFELC